MRAWLNTVLLAVAVGALVYASADFHRLAGKLGGTADATTAAAKSLAARSDQAEESLRRLDIVIGNVNDAATAGAELAKTVNGAAAAEITQINATTKELTKTEHATRAAIDSGRAAIDAFRLGTLPRVDKTLDGVDLAVAGIKPSEDNLAAASEALRARLSDPALDASVNNIEKATASLAASAADVQQVVDKYRAEYLKARNAAWAIIKELLPLAGAAAQVVR